MPELPEVQCVINTLKDKIINKTIKEIKVNNYKLREIINKDINILLKNKKILEVERKGKYIIIKLSEGFIVSHLGMTGKLVTSQEKEKHEHIILTLNDNSIIKYIDPRKFGFFLYVEKLEDNKYLSKLGIDPFDKNCNANFLYSKIKNSKKNIKLILLDQSYITGIGNIYACEILFMSKISPLKKGIDISIEDCKKIVNYTKEILYDSIRKGGSTISDYRNSNNEKGNFQKSFNVYGQKKCKVCKSDIEIIKQSSRSTFYCNNCQI